MIFDFKELTDLTLSVNYSQGEDVGVFEAGEICRELFIIYEGPTFKDNKEEFFKQLRSWLDSK